jgi:hypothetical protein
MRWHKLLAAAVLLAAFLTMLFIDRFPRPLIILPALSLAWIVGSPRPTKLKILCAIASTSALFFLWSQLLWTAARNSSLASGDLVFRLYDANCTFPFPGSRYPHEIIRLRKGYPDGSPDALLWCRN